MLKSVEKTRRGFWQLADPKIWIASLVPMLVSFVYSYPDRRSGSIPWFLLAMIAIFLIEIGKNAVNEVVDYISGVDKNIAQNNKTPFSGGKKTIVEEKLTIKQAAKIALFTYLPAVLIGSVIVFFREFNVLWIGILGVGISILYSIPPFKFAYRGMGEIAVGFTFGPLIVAGINLLMTGTIDIRVLIASVPIGILITNVLWINQFPDYEVDKEGSKRNWVVRLGKKTSVYIYGLLFFSAYLSFFALSFAYKSYIMVLPVITIPIAVKSYLNAVKNYDDIPKLVLSNINTVKIYQVTGITMIAAYIIYKFI